MNRGASRHAFLTATVLVAACTSPAPEPTASVVTTTAGSPTTTAVVTSSPLAAGGNTETAPSPAASEPSAAPATGQPPISGGLDDALAFAPADARSFAFTDWAHIRDIERVPELSDDPADERRVRFVADLHWRHATPSFFASAKLARHADAWGWDSTDLVWEATVEIATSNVHVLQLPAEFDIATLEALFSERGFDRTEHHGYGMHSRRILPSDEWQAMTDMSISNTALMPELHIVVMSRDADALRQVLDAFVGEEPSLSTEPWAGDATAALGDEAAVRIIASDDLCLQFYGPHGDPDSFWENPADRPNAYQWLGVGYHYPDERPIVTVVLGYENEDDAIEDLGLRAYIATELDLVALERHGARLEFRFRPPEDQPSYLFEVDYVDYFFAVC